MSKVVVPLADNERKALVTLAISQLRGPQDQARYILRQELIKCGLLPNTPTSQPQAPLAPQPTGATGGNRA